MATKGQNSWPSLSAHLEVALNCCGHIWLQDINSQSEQKKGRVSPAELIRWKDAGSQELFLSRAYRPVASPFFPLVGERGRGRDGHQEGSHKTGTGNQGFAAPIQSAKLAHGHSSSFGSAFSQFYSLTAKSLGPCSSTC